ncbi:MAG: C40 family peptidase [Flavitalea sp.]
MVKQTLPAIAFLLILSSCTSLKPLSLTSNKQETSQSSKNTQSRFIEDISMTPQGNGDRTQLIAEPIVTNKTRRGYSVEALVDKQESRLVEGYLAALSRTREEEVEIASSVELKYAVLLNTEVESLPSKALLESVDEWYGVRYRRGGVSKSGIDCSGFSCNVYQDAYGIALPRVSREQYRISRKISTTELQEGDLVFFNTTGGGVSHVGVYLGNSKFIHASVSKGVMVNSLFENYYVKRFIGAGRIDKETVSANKP